MKKGLISLLSAFLLFGASAYAQADTDVTVLVNGCEIVCQEQDSFIEDGVTYVPARNVFTVMGAKISWYSKDQKIVIDSKDNITRVILHPDSNVMTVATFTSVINSIVNEVQLDGPVKIVNDRTFIPLRAVSEALGADVSWDDTTKTASITIELPEKDKLLMSIESNVEDVNAGDEVKVYIKVDNLYLYPDCKNGGMTATIKYNKDEFTFVSANLVDAKGNESSSLGASNPDYLEDSAKMAYIDISGFDLLDKSQNFAVMTFKALTDDGGEFSLVSRYTNIGYDTEPLFLQPTEDGQTNAFIVSKLTDLSIDTTPIIIK